jgi:hypothetical protein
MAEISFRRLGRGILIATRRGDPIDPPDPRKEKA